MNNNTPTKVFQFYYVRAPRKTSNSDFEKLFVKHPFDKLITAEFKDKKSFIEFGTLSGSEIYSLWKTKTINNFVDYDIVADAIENWNSVYKIQNIEEFESNLNLLFSLVDNIQDTISGIYPFADFIKQLNSLNTFCDKQIERFIKQSPSLSGKGINVLYQTLWLNYIIFVYNSGARTKNLILRDYLTLSIKLVSLLIGNKIDIKKPEKTVLISELEKTLVLPQLVTAQNVTSGEYSLEINKLPNAKSKKNDGVIQLGQNQLNLPEFCIKENDIDPCNPKKGFYSQFQEGVKPKVQFAGVADLVVTKKQLAGYVTGEVANVTNILKGEEREFSHRRLNIVEEKTETEIETLEENERELSTTEKFELEKEVEKVVDKEASFDAGLTVSYDGTPVKVDSSLNYSQSTSTHDSSKEATKYSKDITSKAITKLSKKVREYRSKLTRKEIEEITKHKFNNIDGNNNIAGFYCWLNAKYRFVNYNYGSRLFISLYIPIPSAQYVHLNLLKNSTQINKPIKNSELLDLEKFCKGIATVSDVEIKTYALKYGIELDIIPLSQSKSICITYDDGGHYNQTNQSGFEDVKPFAVKSNEVVDTPDNFEFYKIRYGVKHYWEPSGVAVNLLVNYESGNIVNGVSDNAEATISNPICAKGLLIALQGKAVSCSALVTYYFRPTNAFLENIKLKNKLKFIAKLNELNDIYNSEINEYNEKLEQLKFQEQDFGNNPNINRIIEQEELKKHSLSIIGNHYFMSLDAMQYGVGQYGYPEFMFHEAENEGKYIHFMEKAFQWQFMNYEFYGYYWADKGNWPFMANLKDNDPLFEKFLKAGYAEVRLAVTPGFEAHVMWLLHTGRIHYGPNAPVVEGLSEEVANIIKANIEIEENEIKPTISKPWESIIPTNEVYLTQATRLGEYQNSTDVEELNSLFKLDDEFKF